MGDTFMFMRGLRTSAAVIGCVCLFATATASHAQVAPGFSGRWVIAGASWFGGQADGRGRGPARGAGVGSPGGGTSADEATPRLPEVVLDLQVSSGGVVSGVATGVGGRRMAPGGHPAHPVQITRGALRGDALSFEIWQFDGFHNRLFVDARLADGQLQLEFRRETPDGPDVFSALAQRASR